MKVVQDENIDIDAALSFVEDIKKGTTTKPASDVPITESASLDNYNHGDIVVGEDGIAGFVIDKEKHLRDIAENDPELNMMKTLIDSSDPTFSKIDPDVEKTAGTNEALEKYLETHPDVRLKRDEVRAAFSGWDIGGSGMLVPKNHPQAKAYREAMAKVQSGEVRLPTVEEYEQQEKEARERNAKAAQQSIEAHKQAEQVKQSPVIETKTEEPVVSAPKIPKFEEMEEMNMSTDERNQVIGSTEDPAVAAIKNASKEKKTETKTKEPEPAVEVTTEEEQTQDTETVPEKEVVPIEETTSEEVVATGKQAPINLFEMQEQLDKATGKQAPTPTEQPVAQEEPTSAVTLEVPAEKADTFMNTLKPRVAEKVETANVVKVNFVKKIDLPNAARRITDIDAYRAVAPKNVSTDISPRVLINSGYIGYFRACGSLKWSRLTPNINQDGEFEDMDEAKIIQFCFEQLATTSIGNMSYRKFLENTSRDDIPAMLHAIMGASLPDEQQVVLTCGQCGGEFETTYHISELPDYETMTDEAKDQVIKVESVKDIIDDANDIHEESPVMTKYPYTASSTGTIFVFKHSDLATTVDRQPVIPYLVERYGASSAALSTVISEVYIKIGEGDSDDDWSLSTDPTVICEELFRIDSTNLDEMKAVVEQIPTIAPITYSFKDSRTCTRCNTELTRLSQDIRSLVFQVALKAHYFV